MLRRLTVRNLAIIPQLAIEFGDGLTVITGESGAGKSIMLDALGLALGARASTDRIRPGAKQAEAGAEFEIATNGECAQILSAHALLDADEPGRCTTRRVLYQDGRSRAFVNDQAVTRKTLTEVGDSLVDIQAQFENVRLARRDVQLKLLDDYGVPAQALSRMRDAWRNWQQTKQTILELESQSGGSADQRSLAAYQLEELAALNPQDGEYEAIDAEHARLSQVESRREIVARALRGIEESDALRAVAAELGTIVDPDRNLDSVRGNLDTVVALLDEAASDLRQYTKRLEADPARMAELDERLARLHEVARKHRVGPAELPTVRDRLTRESVVQQSQVEQLDQLHATVVKQAAEYQKLAKQVSKARNKAGPKFGSQVGKCMRVLGMADAEFRLEYLPAESERGLETVEFQISGHRDYPPQRLGRIASGGEQARIALAIAVVAARKSALPCLVLDEADIGVGGVTADTVGRMLRDLANRTQVICVTHAPQVAALGANHLRVTRSDDGDTRIDPLVTAERVEEIARMLSGAKVTDQARANAQELLQGSAV